MFGDVYDMSCCLCGRIAGRFGDVDACVRRES